MLAAPQALAATSAIAAPVASGPIVWGFRQAKCVDDLGNPTSNDTPIVISDCNDGFGPTDGEADVTGFGSAGRHPGG